jgi:phage shock protein A
MNERRSRGLIGRFTGLLQGWLSAWVGSRENGNPHAVYEQAIRERRRQYAELKQGVAGILYMRNKLDAELAERRKELGVLHADIERAVRGGFDDLALELIGQKERLLEDLERTQRELDEIVAEAGAAKGNLIRFRSEIHALEREKVRMLAVLANARARRRIQEALEGLSLDSDMEALDNVREQIARMRTESNLDRELGGDTGLRARVRALHDEARSEAARGELEELKRRLRPLESSADAPNTANGTELVLEIAG